jgi:hypothetical protein
MKRAHVMAALVASGSASLLGATAGCNAKTATVLDNGSDGSTGGNGSSGSISECCDASAKTPCELEHGGACYDPSVTPPASEHLRKAGVHEGFGTCYGALVCWIPDTTPITPPSAVCVHDADCNGYASTGNAGHCFNGFCFCTDGTHLEDDGRCGPTLLPCAQVPSEIGSACENGTSCPEGYLAGDTALNATCGDFAAAVCCTPASKCVGPIDLQCLTDSFATKSPICVDGWMTCPAGSNPSRSMGFDAGI